MKNYVAPELDTLTPRAEQAALVSQCVESVQDIGDWLWAIGRGAGKSTTRALIAQAILNEGDDYPLYEVRPIRRGHDA